MGQLLNEGQQFFPVFMEPNDGISSVSLMIMRVSDGQFYDFDDGQFKASAWTTKERALTERTEGVWSGTAWQPPTGNGVSYQAFYKDNESYVYGGDVIQVGFVSGGSLVLAGGAGRGSPWTEDEKKKVLDRTRKILDAVRLLVQTPSVLEGLQRQMTEAIVETKKAQDASVRAIQETARVICENVEVAKRGVVQDIDGSRVVSERHEQMLRILEVVQSRITQQVGSLSESSEAAKQRYDSLSHEVQDVARAVAALLPSEDLETLVHGG